MTTPFRVRWHAAAERDLLALPHWRTAARVAEAVEEFAARGTGQIERLSGTMIRLRVGGYAAILSVDVGAEEISVWHVQ